MSDSIARPATPQGPWQWLLDLRGHLMPELEVVDAEGAPLLPAVRGEVADRLRRHLTAAADAPLRTLVRQARSGEPAIVARFEGLRIAALGVTDRGGHRFTLLLVERADMGREAVRRAELARMASWLARGVTSAPHDPLRDWREISVLHQVLQKGVASGTLTAVIGAYVNALAVWADIDTRAYVGNDDGRFDLAVSLAGARDRDAPRSVTAGMLGSAAARRRLETDEAVALGFIAGVDAVLSPIHIANQAPWLLAYAGRFASADENRLALFEDMLLAALEATSAVEFSRLSWAMVQPLVDSRQSPRAAAATAIGELERVGLCTAALIVSRPDTHSTVIVGSAVPENDAGGAWPAACVRHVTLDVPAPFTAVLTMWRPRDHSFSARETRVSQVGASVLGAWAAGLLRQRDADAGRTGEALIERRRPAAVTVSLLVILPQALRTAVHVRETWVGDIRRQLRPSDIAGALPSGDISLLLPGASDPEARAVARRLSRLFSRTASLALLDGAPIGIASVGPTASSARR